MLQVIGPVAAVLALVLIMALRSVLGRRSRCGYEHRERRPNEPVGTRIYEAIEQRRRS